MAWCHDRVVVSCCCDIACHLENGYLAALLWDFTTFHLISRGWGVAMVNILTHKLVACQLKGCFPCDSLRWSMVYQRKSCYVNYGMNNLFVVGGWNVQPVISQLTSHCKSSCSKKWECKHVKTNILTVEQLIVSHPGNVTTSFSLMLTLA